MGGREGKGKVKGRGGREGKREGGRGKGREGEREGRGRTPHCFVDKSNPEWIMQYDGNWVILYLLLANMA